ncbi:PLP-dependent aminotransferase family protein [Oharaeibacter diazotrophicus]|uniref:DNA-binding transcriptional MocR family regulator n=1 Tax=Oharaeibacter diazotrophicus TaxID=1920512 RepID=A0A4R6RL12_9HYPH|nr:PLP-dependent aminotransferase family protein [Oharaeibacter diazotrophicus]TDP87184.1 DNA-binding transcriptional MocR family regulator [Oharaeibacter diazotrophicus]BBE70873.1 putative HTH-type transcriptional regulator YjiR [Pleomorphomonas sp. SM30]GLS77622.1 GntR family transcriptional regulator [Oharaeibacter diazotrophicus]
MRDWLPDLGGGDRPRYLAIADGIDADIRRGRLAPGDRLPPQRKLAARLGIDFTTVARGYVEAQKRGLIESRVGQGSFVRSAPPRAVAALSRRGNPVDFAMNLPPEPHDPALVERMRTGLEEIGRDLPALLRYQGFGGNPADKDAASNWLGRRALVPSQDRLFVVPGAHAALTAILCTLCEGGDAILCEDLTYPGIKAIAAQVGVGVIGLPMDDYGIDPDALREACERHRPKALYLNPTLLNPTTVTIPEKRREAIARIARRHGLPIVEDDAYGFIPQHGPPPFAAIAPDLTWHVAGLAKCIGAGLRIAYVVTPDVKSSWPFAAAVRAAAVMASPLTAALATRWIEDGTADQILRFVREETHARQAMATQLLPANAYLTDPLAFHVWLKLPKPWTRAGFVARMRRTGIGVVAADAFAAGRTPPEAVRVCLGGAIDRGGCRRALEYAAHILEQTPDSAGDEF